MIERKTKVVIRKPLCKKVVKVKRPIRRVVDETEKTEPKAEEAKTVATREGYAPQSQLTAKESDKLQAVRKAKTTFGAKIKAAKATKPEPTRVGSHLIVEARAGTGKTFTLVEGIKRILNKPTPGVKGSPQQEAVWEAMIRGPKPSSSCFVAFNRSIATELKTKVPAGCNAMTLHSMGYRALTKTYRNVGEPCKKTSFILEDFLGKDIRDLRREKPVVVKAVDRLVELCKMTLTVPVEDPEAILSRLADHYEVDLEGEEGQDYREEVFGLVPQVLAESARRTNQIDYADMVWLPVVNNLPVWRYDLLLVDEAQDLNRCQQALAMKAGRRLILCGDPCQAIYGFAGADVDSIPRMQSLLGETPAGCRTLPLTMTRRCGMAIVEQAKEIVPDFEAWKENPAGEIKTASLKTFAAGVTDGDMILCRVNAPLVSQCFKLVASGKKANIQGRDIGEGLIRLVESLNALDVPDLCGRVDDWYSAESAKENAKKEPDEAKLIGLQDKRDCLLAFSQGTTSLDEVSGKINRLFSDDRSGGILLSSVHRAKGLEARRVFILLPKGAGMPHPMAKSVWQVRQEYNLKYVAITRAIEVLTFVTEDPAAFPAEDNPK